MPTPLIIPPSHPPLSPMPNDRPGPVGGRLRSFAHLWPLVTSDKFVLETVTRGYRIEFTSKPPTTSKVWWTETPKNPSRREDLERGLQSMLDKKAIREIPVSPDTPGFYSPIFLVAKESGGWRPILNLKAFNKFVVPPSFRMETLRTVMDCLGEAANLRVGRPFLHPDPTMSIVTDASKEGWGGHLGDLVVSGLWSRAWAKRHIN